jgi:uncharacterized membrane protein YhaH (DUF805 family)
MGFFEALRSCFSKYFDFSGRASRSEFWYFRLFIVLISMLLNILVNLFSGFVTNANLTLLFLGLGVAILIPDLSVQVRRLHDRDLSGFWLLPIYIVIPGIIGGFFYTNNKIGHQLTAAHEQGLLVLGVVWLAWALGILFVDLLPGTEGKNRYGPDPLGRSTNFVYDSSQPEQIKRGQRDTLRGGKLEAQAAGFQDKKIITEQASTVTQIDAMIIEKNLCENEIESLKGDYSDQYEVQSKSQSYSKDEAIEILLKHDDAVRGMIDKCSGLPNNVVQRILLEILQNSGDDLIQIRNSVILESLGRPDLVWSDELESVISIFKSVDPEKVDEFFKVFPVLSRRMSIRDIRDKVITLPESVFYVKSATGRDIKITQRGEDTFEFTSLLNGLVSLNSLGEVFEYLGTPKNDRKKRKSW